MTCISISIHLCICHLCIIWLAIYLSIYPLILLSPYPSVIYLPVYPSIYLPISPCIHQSIMYQHIIYLSIYPSIHPFFCLLIHLSTFLLSMFPLCHSLCYTQSIPVSTSQVQTPRSSATASTKRLNVLFSYKMQSNITLTKFQGHVFDLCIPEHYVFKLESVGIGESIPTRHPMNDCCSCTGSWWHSGHAHHWAVLRWCQGRRSLSAECMLLSLHPCLSSCSASARQHVFASSHWRHTEASSRADLYKFPGRGLLQFSYLRAVTCSSPKLGSAKYPSAVGSTQDWLSQPLTDVPGDPRLGQRANVQLSSREKLETIHMKKYKHPPMY